MTAITSLSIIDGATAHLSLVVLDQYGNAMPAAVATIVDPGPNTSFAPDSGVTNAGVVTALTPGVDNFTGSYAALVAPVLAVTVTPAASVPTSLVWTSP